MNVRHQGMLHLFSIKNIFYNKKAFLFSCDDLFMLLHNYTILTTTPVTISS